MGNEKKEQHHKPVKKAEKNFVPLKEVCTYRLTIECEMVCYNEMIESINNYATVVKEEIETEV